MDATPAELDRLLTHGDWLRALARRLVVDSATAEDLVQETWLAAMKNPPDPDRPVRPWLAGVVRRLARMRLRAEGRRSYRQTAAARRDELPSTAEMVEHVDTQRRLAEVVLELPEPYRTTVLHRYYHGLSAAEIARREGVPAGTVRWRLKRGVDTLREQLDESYTDRREWCVALASFSHLAATIEAPAPLVIEAIGLTGLLKIAAAAALAVGAWVWLPGVFTGGGEAHAALDPGSNVDSPDAGLVTGQDEDAVAGRESVGDAPIGAAVAITALRVRILEEDGSAAARRKVVVVDSLGGDFTGETDEHGWFETPSRSGSGELWVDRDSAFPARWPIDLGAGELVLAIPEGRELSGRLVVDGSPPEERLVIAIDTDRQLFPEGDLPASVRAAMGTGRRAVTTTDDEGRFHFRVPADDWSGALWLPPGYVRRGDWHPRDYPRTLHIDAPGSAVVLEIERLARARGRVVEPDGRAPVAGAIVAATFSWPDGREFREETRAGDDGRFDLFPDRREPSGVRLEYSTSDGRGQEVRSFELDRLDGVDGVGDLPLARGRRLELTVVDGLGAGIEGAVGRPAGGTAESAPTGADGRGALAGVGDGVESIEVWAPGFLARTVELPSRGATTLRVVLTQASRLELRVATEGGDGVGHAHVRVVAERGIFAATGGYVPDDPTRRAMVGKFRTGRSRETDGIANFETDGDGRLVVPGLTPDQSLWVEALDPLRNVMQTLEISALSGGEERELVLTVPRPLRTLRGVVRDEAGEILLGVTVEVRGQKRNGASVRSGLDGTFEMAHLDADHVQLEVTKPGYVTRSFLDLALPTDGELLQLTLARGHTVAVTVADADGKPIADARVVARPVGSEDGWDRQAVELEPGAYELVDLPAERHEVRLHAAGVEIDVVLEPLDGELAFEVPSTGSLVVDWRLPEGAAERGAHRLSLVRTDAPPVTVSIGGDAGTGGSATFEAVVPGEYELFVEFRPTLGDDPRFTAVGEGNPVVIVAGEPARAEIER